MIRITPQLKEKLLDYFVPEFGDKVEKILEEKGKYIIQGISDNHRIIVTLDVLTLNQIGDIEHYD